MDCRILTFPHFHYLSLRHSSPTWRNHSTGYISRQYKPGVGRWWWSNTAYPHYDKYAGRRCCYCPVRSGSGRPIFCARLVAEKTTTTTKKKQYFTYYPVFVFPFNPYLFRLNISNPTSCHTNSHSFNSLSLSFFLSVCVTGDLQAYAVRNVTTTAGLNSTGVVVGSGTGQSLQVPKSIWGCYDACA